MFAGSNWFASCVFPHISNMPTVFCLLRTFGNVSCQSHRTPPLVSRPCKQHRYGTACTADTRSGLSVSAIVQLTLRKLPHWQGRPDICRMSDGGICGTVLAACQDRTPPLVSHPCKQHRYGTACTADTSSGLCPPAMVQLTLRETAPLAKTPHICRMSDSGICGSTLHQDEIASCLRASFRRQCI